MTADVPTTKAPVDERRTTAWIGQGVTVEGRISSAQDLRIDGTVEGTIEVGQHGVIVGASAVIRANLAAKTILISGTVTGNVTATERIDLQPGGSVEGDVTAPRLVMADGAVIKGRVDAGGNKMARIRAAEEKTEGADVYIHSRRLRVQHAAAATRGR